MLSDNQLVHCTDHSFQKLCEQKYGINRGVYNVIDRWFYEHGLKNIISRRKEILSFLCFMSYRMNATNPVKKIKFGRGGLVNTLEEFWYEEEHYQSNSKII